MDSEVCSWHIIGGKYLRGTNDFPRYPKRKEIDEIMKTAGGREKVMAKMNPSDRAFQLFTHVRTCGACLAKCRAPWT
ncbi:MAG: hypothetical protein ABSB22_11900 [Thermodesulfobacteriota bacterium]